MAQDYTGHNNWFLDNLSIGVSDTITHYSLDALNIVFSKDTPPDILITYSTLCSLMLPLFMILLICPGYLVIILCKYPAILLIGIHFGLSAFLGLFGIYPETCTLGACTIVAQNYTKISIYTFQLSHQPCRMLLCQPGWHSMGWCYTMFQCCCEPHCSWACHISEWCMVE